MAKKMTDSIRYQFLLRILPAFFFTSVIFLLVLTSFELNTAKEAKRELAKQKVENLALLLTEPVWQLSNTLSSNIMSATIEAHEITCVVLEQDSEITPIIVTGSCKKTDAVETFSHPIIYTNQGRDRLLGKVSIQMVIKNDWKAISRKILPLITLSAILFVLTVVISLLAFRSTILAPLAHVSYSLRHYQKTGTRKPVDWKTNDELGLLIQEYNNSLKHQQQTENQLETAKHEAEKARHDAVMALNNLKQAQKSLVQAEKMASLGNLVAGIAHEVNTPLGNSLTIATTITEATKEISKDIESGALRKIVLENYIQSMNEASTILERNLHNAADQIRKFKQVAVDQTSEKRRKFDLRLLLDEVLYTLYPQVKHSPYSIKAIGPEGILMNSYPGQLGQIITNCFNNAILHGFEGKESGQLTFSVERLDDEWASLIIEDNGCGMPPEELKKAFDPFYTTKLGQGGSGLGLNLVYNLTTSLLGGNVSISSVVGQGLKLSFKIPVNAPSSH